jgi:hypothetical protein
MRNSMEKIINDEKNVDEEIEKVQKDLLLNKSTKEALLKDLINSGAPQETIDAYREKLGLPKEPTSEEKKEEPPKPKEDPKAKEKAIAALRGDINETLGREERTRRDQVLEERMRRTGLGESDFIGIPEWGTLSHGEKLLVLEQISQDTLSHIKEIGEKRFQEKNKIKFSLNPKKWSASSGKKLANNFIKSYWISKEEKEVLKDAEMGRLKPDAQTLSQLVERTADMKLNVVEQEGRPIIEFMSLDKNLSPEEQHIVTQYNAIANEFARMPDAWKNKKAARSTDGFMAKNHAHYEEVKSRYEQARLALVDIKATQQGRHESQEMAKEKAMLEMKDIDFQIAMLQFTNTNPDAVAELKKIETQSSIGRLVNKETIWRGLYMGAGYATRSITASTLGLMSGPLVASIIGGTRARMKASGKINEAFHEGRTIETFQERKEAGKEGLFDDKNAGKKGLATNIMPGKTGVNAKEVAAFVDADSQVHRLSSLMDKLETTTNQKERSEILSALTARIQYVEKKHEEGLINYGTKNAVGLNYELLKIMSEAQVKAREYEIAPDGLINLAKITNPTIIDNLDPQFLDTIQDGHSNDVRRRELLEYVTNLNKGIMESNQSYFKNTETARGALVGAGFSLLGWKIRDWMHGSHDIDSLRNRFKEATGGGVPHSPLPVEPNPTVIHPPVTPVEPTPEPTPTPVEPTPVPHPRPHVEPHTPSVEKEIPKIKVVDQTDPTEAKIDIVGPGDKPLVDAPLEPFPVQNPVTTEEPFPVQNSDVPTDANFQGGLKTIYPTQGTIITPESNGFTTPVKDAFTPVGTAPTPEPYQNIGQGNISPTRGIYETGNGTITPTQQEYETAGNVPTRNVIEGGDNHIKSIESDPRHQVETEKDVRHTFGRSHVITEEAPTKTINGVETEEWNKTADKIFEEQKVTFKTYEEYEKEDELQRLFGKGEQHVRYVPEIDKNAEVVDMQYFRKLPEWNIVEKIPAKNFFDDFTDPHYVDGTNIPQSDLDALVKAGVLKQNAEVINGQRVYSYVFSNKAELNRISEFYGQKGIEPLNKYPIENESIEKYVARVTRSVNQTDDGTLYAFKPGEGINSRPNGVKVTLFGDFANEQTGGMGGGTRVISPTSGGGGYQTRSDYGPNRGLVSQGANVLTRGLLRRWLR